MPKIQIEIRVKNIDDLAGKLEQARHLIDQRAQQVIRDQALEQKKKIVDHPLARAMALGYAITMMQQWDLVRAMIDAEIQRLREEANDGV